MSRKCQLSGQKRQTGNRVSHAKNRTKHVFQVNLQRKRIFVPELGKHVTLKVSTSMLRTIDKLSLQGALKKLNISLDSLMA